MNENRSLRISEEVSDRRGDFCFEGAKQEMIFRKRKEETAEAAMEQPMQTRAVKKTPEELYHGPASLGIVDVFALKEEHEKDIMVVGRLKGTLEMGETVYLMDFGKEGSVTRQATVGAIQITDSELEEIASDRHVGLLIPGGAEWNIHKGMILYTKDTPIGDLHSAYISALGDSYVVRQKLEFEDKDVQNLCLADLAEIWRLYRFFKENVEPDKSPEEMKNTMGKLDALSGLLAPKVLEAESVYCLINKTTGEPQMFSQTHARQDGNYECSAPNILLYTASELPVIMARFPEDGFEHRKIENGENKRGIYEFLGSAFYENGASGVCLQSPEVTLDKSRLVEQAVYCKETKLEREVTNPSLVRWILLLGQIGKPQNEEQEILYRLYYGFLSEEMKKATLLIPTREDGAFPLIEGKNRNGVRAYTDRKRLRLGMGEDLQATVQPMSQLIRKFDCAINVVPDKNGGVFITQEMFKEGNGK